MRTERQIRERLEKLRLLREARDSFNQESFMEKTMISTLEWVLGKRD